MESLNADHINEYFSVPSHMRKDSIFMIYKNPTLGFFEISYFKKPRVFKSALGFFILDGTIYILIYI